MAGGGKYLKGLSFALRILGIVTRLGRPQADCPKCATHLIGWALRNPRHETCPKCGARLEVTDGGRRVTTGYSPLTTERHRINLPSNIPPINRKQKDNHVKNK